LPAVFSWDDIIQLCSCSLLLLRETEEFRSGNPRDWVCCYLPVYVCTFDQDHFLCVTGKTQCFIRLPS